MASTRPTAQTSLGPAALTPASLFCAVWALGLETTLQALPSQCRVSVRVLGPSWTYPTAHTSLVATPVTAYNSFPSRLGLGAGMMLQAVPSQCTVSTAAPAWPTAHTSFGPTAAT